MGFEEEGGPPLWLTDHLIAESYGCTPQEVKQWPVDDFNQAVALMSARSMAEKSRRLKSK